MTILVPKLPVVLGVGLGHVRHVSFGLVNVTGAPVLIIVKNLKKYLYYMN